MYIKAYFLNQCSTAKLTNSEKKNENYDCKSKIKHKFERILGVIRNLGLDFILFFVTAYMRKYPTYLT